jgi:AAA+ superfamily predicted ATPase
MKSNIHLDLNGIPDEVSSTSDAAIFRSRIINAADRFLESKSVDNLYFTISTKKIESRTSDQKKEEINIEERANRYKSKKPLYGFDRLVIPDDIKDDILLAVDFIEVENKIYNEWGLREIEPFPKMALNLHGKSGTGKTLAAHAIADKIKRPILESRYSDIDSMYHSVGAKNIKALFYAAKRDHAVLFIDEADSLLSKRILNVNQGSEQSINSIRSELLISIEEFEGIIIFATNLVQTYDKAFETRLHNIYFPMPDINCRKQIWSKHLVKKMPISGVDIDKLSEFDDISGREIKRSVILAATRAARLHKDNVSMEEIVSAISHVKKSRIVVQATPDEINELEESYKKIKE